MNYIISKTQQVTVTAESPDSAFKKMLNGEGNVISTTHTIQSLKPPTENTSGTHPKKPMPVITNPGNLFSTIIFKITGQRTTNCGVCGQRKIQMNTWGWWGCWKNRKIILGWLAEEAKKRGHPISEAKLFDLLKAAFKEARCRSNRLH